MQIIELFEKMDVVDELSPYIGDNFFFQFTNILKIGINPQFGWDFSIAGMYAYPSKKIWNDILKDNDFFADNRKYVNVIELIDNSKILYTAKYTYSQLLIDLKKLVTFGYEINFNFIDKIISNNFDKKRMFKIIYDIIFEKEMISSKVTNIFRKLGYEGIIDNYNLLNNIPSQAVFFTIKPLKLIKTIDNKRRHIISGETVSPTLQKSLQSIYGKHVFNINDLDDQEKIKKIAKNPMLVRFLKNPSEELLLNLAKKNKNCIRYMINPPYHVIAYVVNKAPYMMRYVSKKMAKQLVTDYPDLRRMAVVFDKISN